MPVELLNFPNKNKWLSTPSLKVEALKRLQYVLSLTSTYVNFLLLYIFLGVVRFHTEKLSVFDTSFLYMILFSVACLLFFVFALFKPPTASNEK